MLKTLLTGAALGCILVPPAAAQQTDAERVDALLKSVEQKMQALNSFRASCKRTDIHPLTKKATILSGEVAWRKPNLAKIDLYLAGEAGVKDQDKSQLERYIADGKVIWEYSLKEKTIVAHEMPKDGAADNVLLSIVRGMKADELKKRFDIKLTKSDGVYAHLRLMPKNDADRQDFAGIDLFIWIKNPNPEDKADLTYTLAQIRWFQPNGRQIIYRFGDMELNAKLDDTTFTARSIPGFEVKRAAFGPTAPAPQPSERPSNR